MADIGTFRRYTGLSPCDTPDFMFQMTKEDIEEWKSQFVISNSIKMGLRKPPYAFTVLGVAMLSSVLGRPTIVNSPNVSL
jgi:hypothetical protein